MRIENKDVMLFGNPNGSYNNKFNRAVKIACMYEQLKGKLDSFMETGSVTYRTRCALAVKLMMMTGIRVGNEDSAEGYVSKRKDALGRTIQTYGLTTLRRRHLLFRGGACYVNFMGKREVKQALKITDKKLVGQLKKVADESDDTLLGITDYDVRKFIRKSVGRRFTPKDFRTFFANVTAWECAERLLRETPPQTRREFKEEIKEVAMYVRTQLHISYSIFLLLRKRRVQ